MRLSENNPNTYDLSDFWLILQIVTSKHTVVQVYRV